MLKTININSAAVAVLAVAAFAHTPRIESDDVNRVASHIACRWGACTESVSCPMSKSGCSFCVPAKARIYEMQKAGIPDAAIIDVYRKEYGDNIYLSDPSLFYVAVPAFATVLGLLAVYWFINRFKERAAPLVTFRRKNSELTSLA
jgi:cytochrome c-type biogenesis protein CcmH/NrfF